MQRFSIKKSHMKVLRHRPFGENGQFILHKPTFMKVLYRRLFFLCSALLLVPLASCIKEEKANVECDIENIVVAQEDLITYTKIDRNRAIVSMKRKSDDFAEEINPTYVVSEGATYVIEDKNDRDAVHIEHVKVTSEDQQYSKTYTVIYTPTEIPENFGFEYCE